jgi:eukaryotic-like serine/threonine-protein kinase
MDLALQKRALAVLEDALEHPDPTRADWLRRTHGNDPRLVGEVEALLRADAAGARALPTLGLQAPATSRPRPERVGHYRIVERLGEGGMGEVFVGARDDGLFDHEVAIKIVRPSLLPEAAQALFHKERRALAKLSHRHIAQLFDGGVDEAGAPYLIMELVRGVSVDAFAHGRDLGLRQIAELVIGVCDAVQHAHQNLIVHADLKPANILVNEVGDAKIVDFGVARILREAESGEAPALYPQTPGYASPQRYAGAAPTPADDVFALGAILRALTCGQAPTPGAPVGALQETILTSPAFMAKAQAWRLARARQARGDLEAVITRACAEGATDRYPSAAALGDDLRAWLSHRPLAARRGDRTYVLRKFLRRRRLRVLAGAAALLGLFVALGVTSHLYVQADRARALAESRFADVRGLARYLLFEVYDRLERTPRSLAMRRDVAAVGQSYLDQLARDPAAPTEVRLEVIEGIVRIADLQAGRHYSNLGEPGAARGNLERAEVLALRLATEDVDATVLAAIRARIALRRASLAMNVDQDLSEAGRFIEAAHEFAARAPDQSLALEIGVEAATLANWRGQHTQAASLARAMIAMAESIATPIRETHFLHSRAWDALAEALYYQDDLPGAEAAYRNYAALTAAYRRGHLDDMEGLRNAVRARWALGTTLLQRERHREGLAELDHAASQVPALLSFEPADEGAQRLERVVLTARAQALALNGRFVEGARLLRANVERRRELYRAAPEQAEHARAYAISLAMLADLFADRRQGVRACPLYAEAAAVFGELERRGQLARLDRETALHMINERRAGTC